IDLVPMPQFFEVFSNKIFTLRIAKLIGFYVVFYTCLSAIFFLFLSLYLGTLDYEIPRFYGKGTVIGNKPGIGYQPWLIDDPDSTLIKFIPNKRSSYAHYVSAIKEYLAKYENTTNTRNCTGNESNLEIVRDWKLTEERKPACRFDLKIFKDFGCNETNDFGFAENKPCVVLSLNRLIGWMPTELEGEIPKEISDRYQKGFITFNCYGVHDWDKKNIGEIEYIPSAGIDIRFYPYAVMPNYHQPITMVKFNNLIKNVLIKVECRAYAGNIVHDIINRLGLVRFEIFLHDSIE
uniref:Sodium/potassium-transporting ATPase subunit beta n=1 Tax=Acrobeloides nanus TaxID=290746 RepID=A0A914D4L0_9BILA